jgi:hypothetical protein
VLGCRSVAELPVRDQCLVGALGLFGEFPFFVAPLLVVVGSAWDRWLPRRDRAASSSLRRLCDTRLGRAKA